MLSTVFCLHWLAWPSALSVFQLAVLDLNSADGQGAGTGRKFYFIQCFYDI